MATVWKHFLALLKEKLHYSNNFTITSALKHLTTIGILCQSCTNLKSQRVIHVVSLHSRGLILLIHREQTLTCAPAPFIRAHILKHLYLN